MCQTWNRSAQSYKHHSCDRVLEADGATKVRCQVTNHCRQKADDNDGHDKAGPPIPIVSGRNKGKKELPENSEEMHNIVKARRQLFHSGVIIIVIIT